MGQVLLHINGVYDLVEKYSSTKKNKNGKIKKKNKNLVEHTNQKRKNKK